jgi:hypothetical protein
MSLRLRLFAALAFGCTGAAAAVAASCAIHIGGLVAPIDAEMVDGAGIDAGVDADDGADTEPNDAPVGCTGQTCDSNAQCCGSAPSCTNAHTCAITCATLDAAQCSPPECCLGLFCENFCRACHDLNEICSTNNSCCNNNCVDSGAGYYCR